MDNSTISEHLDLIAKLIDIHGEDSSKSKTYSIASFNIEKLPLPLKDTPEDQIFKIRGIGESLGQKIIELLETGKIQMLTDYISNTPPGVIEMLNIKGIGPKKIHTIWKEMEIESLGELLYACNENRLTRFKGFGEKTQKNVQDAIEFYFLNQGHFLYAQLDEIYPQIVQFLSKMFTPEKVNVTGAYRRQEVTIEELEFIVLETNDNIKPKFQTAQPPELLEETSDSLLYKLKNGLKLRLYTGRVDRAKRLFETTGNVAFVEAFQKQYPISVHDDAGKEDEGIFASAGIAFIQPCLRESHEVIQLASQNEMPTLIQPADIRSIIHSHSTWSDGSNTIEEMAKACIRCGLEYLVISDHSQTAFYANGLKEDRLFAQHQQIDELNRELAPFRIFKSIESDILSDGSLDYPAQILETFDLVIASIHSNLKMNEEKAMMRLLNAIRNPYTTILGHMTGRLLLTRNGYPVNHRTIIDACAEHQVVIELNAHPRRLDMDWKWIDYAMEKNVLISIDPDAHFIEGFDDIKYGVLAAQKGGLTKEYNLSSFDLKQFEQFLHTKKTKRSTTAWQ